MLTSLNNTPDNSVYFTSIVKQNPSVVSLSYMFDSLSLQRESNIMGFESASLNDGERLTRYVFNPFPVEPMLLRGRSTSL